MNKSSMAIGATAVLLAACGTTQQATVSPADLKCGFLGPACAQLSPGSEGQIALRYVNPAAKWTQYSKMMIQPVTFWGDEQSKVSTEDQQRLVNFLYTALDQELAKQFQIVAQDGLDVMKLQVALTDVAAATPGLRTMTMVVPQARLVSTVKRGRSEEHTSEFQSHSDLVCRLLLEKKKPLATDVVPAHELVRT